MKSVFISFLMFAVVLIAMYFDVFVILSSNYVMAIAFILVIAAFIFAFKVLGNPFKKDDKDDNKQ